MPDEITFVDLVALSRIKPDTTVEKYGGMVNASFFDAANILGTLSQKKLITFTTSLPGQNPIEVTEAGKQLLNDANSKSGSDFDNLDFAIVTNIKSGKRAPNDLGSAVNVRPRDLAFHLYKLSQQGYITYEFRSGLIDIMLTEKGFSQANAPAQQKPIIDQPPTTPEVKPVMRPTSAQTVQAAQTEQEVQAPEEQQKKPMLNGRNRLVVAAVAIIIIILVVFYVIYTNGFAGL